MDQRKKPFLKYLGEFLMVAFGVFLGLFANDWSAKEHTRQNMERSLGYIEEELQANIERLDKAIVYHEMIKSGFDSLRAGLSEEILMNSYFGKAHFNHNQIPGWRGVGTANLEYVAFESARPFFHELDFPTLHAISKNYQHQQSYKDVSKVALDKLLLMNSNTKVFDVVITIELVTGDILNYEAWLKEELEKLLQRLQARRKNSD